MDASAREGTAGAGAARRLLRRATTGTVIGLAAGALAALAAQTRLVDTWERRTLDMRVNPLPVPSGPIRGSSPS